ncbi:MAG: hypothetical protein OER56_05420 [Hyphomicrobiales bacterium]|nr:hypothetical protein [Hyphomicrobiales bacterium]
MRTASKFVVSLPLLAGAWVVGIGTMSAAVQDLRPSEAVELLARSEAIDAKCQHLTSAEHQELRDYVARAEVAVAGQTSAKRAGNAVTKGAAAGKTTACGRDSEITVRATMDAARRAIAASDESQPQVASNTQTAALRTNAPARRANASTASYSRLAAAYYVERRCRHLSHAQAVDFWKRIVRLHNAVLSAQGPDALSRAKSRAIAKAKKMRRCNANSAKLVRISYRTIKR